jgi:GntR family transcriptional regulator
MHLTIKPHSKIPVYKQMVASIAAIIENGELEIGERLPSIRELSAQLGVNPNTTAKVYRELELRGFIESRAGSGCFVRPKDEKAAAAAKRANVESLFKRLLRDAQSLQLTEQDVLRFLKTRTET